ncbi:MAG: lipoate--protein ligase family protein [Alphaproteobacteria bacterium]|nr:lipoate--protein ligase family protein [Alphaproteobacteria bacterium]
MRLRVIDQGECSPIASHAIPYGIAATMAPASEPVLTLCNPSSPYVSVGANQDLSREIDEDYCRTHGVAVLRREVGGGAVLIDRNQLYFHFIFPRALVPERAERLFPRFIEPVLRTYAALGLVADYRPLNDIQASGGRKLGATAAAEVGAAIVVAGSFLLDFDRETMAMSLRVPDSAFRDLLRRSLADHVTTMREQLDVLPSRERLKSLFLARSAAMLGVDPVTDQPQPAEAAAIAEAAARHADPAWTHRLGRKLVAGGFKIAEGVHVTEGDRRTPGGLISARLLEKDGRIETLELTGDVTCLPADGLERLARRLAGLELDPAATFASDVSIAVGALALDLPGVSASDLAHAVLSARAR